MERLVKVLAFKLSKRKYGNIFSDNFKIQFYVYQGLLGDLFKILISLGLSIVTQTFIECLIIMITAISLRMFSGGYHAHTFKGCFIFTVGLFLISSILAKIINNYFLIDNIKLIAINVVIIAMAIIYSPKLMIEIPKENLTFYKILSIIHIIIFTIISLALRKIRVSIEVGLLNQILSITPLGYFIFGLINKNLIERKNVNE
jgi:accessory gene regulator B